MEEIFTGKGDYFPGLLPLVYAYLDFINCDPRTYRRINDYLQYIEKSASFHYLASLYFVFSLFNICKRPHCFSNFTVMVCCDIRTIGEQRES